MTGVAMKSSVERKRDERRRKEDDLKRQADASYPYMGESFVDWLGRNGDHGDWEAALLEFDFAGMTPPEFDGDEGPTPPDGYGPATSDDEYHPHAGYAGSVGRAEALIDHLLAGASCVAAALNSYKREQLTDRLRQLEATELPDPTARKRAFDDVVRLQRMLDQLTKTRRFSFAEWRLKGF
jgi:hypothetical protein